MTEKRFKYVEFTKNILSFDDNGVCKFFNEKDFEDWLNELHEENEELKQKEYAYLGEITLYKGEANKRKKENELLKIALCEELQANGSSYHINLFEKIFNLNYDEWERKNEYIEWEDLLKENGEND